MLLSKEIYHPKGRYEGCSQDPFDSITVSMESTSRVRRGIIMATGSFQDKTVQLHGM